MGEGYHDDAVDALAGAFVAYLMFKDIVDPEECIDVTYKEVTQNES